MISIFVDKVFMLPHSLPEQKYKSISLLCMYLMGLPPPGEIFHGYFYAYKAAVRINLRLASVLWLGLVLRLGLASSIL